MSQCLFLTLGRFLAFRCCVLLGVIANGICWLVFCNDIFVGGRKRLGIDLQGSHDGFVGNLLRRIGVLLHFSMHPAQSVGIHMSGADEAILRGIELVLPHFVKSA